MAKKQKKRKEVKTEFIGSAEALKIAEDDFGLVFSLTTAIKYLKEEGLAHRLGSRGRYRIPKQGWIDFLERTRTDNAE